MASDIPQTEESERSNSTTPRKTLKMYISKDMVSTTLFTMRLVTIVGSLLFLLSNFGSAVVERDPWGSVTASVRENSTSQTATASFGLGNNFQGEGSPQTKQRIDYDLPNSHSEMEWTCIGTFGVFWLISGYGYKGYLNAMLTSFFTFSIRLYQRKQERQVYAFSKDMYKLFLTEDSGHYMLYTFFYYNQYPLSIYLIPPFLYALLFSVKYTNGLVSFIPSPLAALVSHLNQTLASSQVELRRFVAYTEIFLMFIVVWNTLTGYMFFLAPMVHFFFLKLRYQSVRNNSISLVFTELRLGTEHLSRHPRCPPFISNLLVKAVAFVSSLAPSHPMRREA